MHRPRRRPLGPILHAALFRLLSCVPLFVLGSLLDVVNRASSARSLAECQACHGLPFERERGEKVPPRSRQLFAFLRHRGHFLHGLRAAARDALMKRTSQADA